MNKALVIGGGPSIEKYGHLKLLQKSNFKGKLFIADVMLKKCLEAGITPDKFPEFYVVSVEFGTYIRNFYTSDLKAELSQKYAAKIRCLLFAYENDFTELLRSLGFQVTVLPDNEHSRTFANVGITGWFLAYDMYKCDEVALIGFNMGRAKDHLKLFPDYFVPLFFKSGYNPDLKSDYILDPGYEYFRETFLEWIEKLGVRTINCSQEGSLYGPGIINMEFKQWLQKRT